MFEGWAAAAATVGAAVVGSEISASGAQSAAQTQANAANNAQQISQQEFNTITQQEQPFLQSGYGALGELNYLLGIPSASTTDTSGRLYPNTLPSGATTGGAGAYPNITQGYDPSSGWTIGAGGSLHQLIPGGPAPPAGSASGVTSSPAGGFGSLIAPFTADTFKQYSPAYQFQLQQGGQGVLNADTSGEGALSGAAQKDLMSFNQNLANTSFNSAFNQYQTQTGNIYSRLAGLAQLGQAAASNTGQQGTALAGQAAQSATNVGTALAAGQVGAANAWAGGVSNLSALPWMMNQPSGVSTEVPDEGMGVGG